MYAYNNTYCWNFIKYYSLTKIIFKGTNYDVIVKNLDDYIINEETDKGFPGFINLINIESLGLTDNIYIYH